ncbi:glycosyltransferase [Paenibacillus sp. yr247]|uniref:glycosyltransferase n=1 Tax=Paenibacillus sp. yr247 TaxID=1761880 RepID=UPI000B86B89E|nr:glycosyltransferase [Paenibacillus sp. yr247]
MNIAFDMSFTLTESKHRSVGKFARRLIRSIRKENPSHTYHSFYPDTGSNALPIQAQLERFLNNRAIDLFQIFSPFEKRLPPLRKAWFGKTKVAVLLQERMIPEELDKIDFIQSCDLILANCESIKQEAIRTAGIAPEKIKLIYGGAGRRFKRVPNDDEALSKFGILKPFVMSTADVTDRQHVSKLIKAFGQVNDQMNRHYQLVITGDLNNVDKKSLLAEAGRTGTNQDVLWLNGMSDRRLIKLYNGAQLFVYPSQDEGSGVTVLEAMACGTPVLTFAHSPFLTISGDAAYQVHPSNGAAIRQGLTACLLDEEVRSNLRSKGFDRTDQFDWYSAGAKVLEAYQYALRKKLAIFSPLTPLKSGIAHYLNVILPSFQENYECDLFINEGYEPLLPPEIEDDQIKRIFKHHVFEQKAHQYDEVMFQLGNSKNHAYMVPYVKKYPGVVILHDLYLNKCSDDDIDDYLKSAKSIIVHNQYAQRFLLNKGYRNVGLCRLPQKLPVMISLLMDRDFVFSSFGRMEENKHIELAIRCVKRLYEEGFTDIRYTIASNGASRYLKKLKSFVSALGLDHIVQFMGYVEQAEYQTMLSHSDVCIQLHNPTDGESSLTLLDVLSHGKAAIVSDIDAYSELPGDVVCKIHHDDNVEDELFLTMHRLYTDKNLRKQLRQRSRSFVADHHPVTRYVERFKRIVENGIYDEWQEGWTEWRTAAIGTLTDATNTSHASVETTRTIYLQPNRYRRIQQGMNPVSYFSFNLNELPKGCVIQSAVMQIPAVTRVLRVHRIKSSWSSQSVSRRKPPVRKYPIFKHMVESKTKLSQSILFTWECTQLAQTWMQDQLRNHGVYVPRISARKKPGLHLVVRGKF